MAGTRTAPIVGALTVTENHIALGLVDASGDLYSEDLKTVGGGLADMAEIQAYAAAYQLGTQASLYEVRHTAIWTGSINPTNAEALFRGTVAEGINMGFRDTDVFNAVYGGRLIAPVAATMVANTDTPVYPLVAPMTTLTAAMIVLLGAGYSLETLQFTGRRERKNNVKIRT
jgi:hypothetical protein